MLMQLHRGRRWPAASFCLALLFSGATVRLYAQAGGAAPQDANTKSSAYEVVSIRPATGNGRDSGWKTLPNGFDFKELPLSLLINEAYGIQMENQVSGLPEWVKNDRYDVSARVDDETAEAWKKLPQQELWKQQQPMLATLLADRCRLKMRREVRQLPVYDLLIAKSGLKMKEAAPDEKSYTMQKQAAFYGGANDGEYTITDTTRAGTASGLAQMLAHSAGRIIVDKTGLGEKRFDYELKWSSSGEAPPDGGDVGPTIFKALEEQLGMKLEPAKEPVDTFVVEHIERPSAN